MPSTSTTRTVTGLTNGTAVQFRVAGVNGIGTGAYSTASAAVTPVAGDALFASVALLLPSDGTGNTFVDASAVPKTITAVGNATQSATQSKWGGKSGLFDGSGDYLTSPANAAFNLPGDWTIEFWVRFSAPPGNYSGAYGAAIASCYQGVGGASGQGWQVRINGNSAGYDTINLYTGQTDLNWSYGGFVLNQWHYVALSRASNVIRAWVDGTQAGSAISNSDSMSSANQFSVGRLANESTYLFDLNGFLDDLRITKGSARGYTGSTITVPTAAFPTRGVYEDPFFEGVSLILPMDGTGSTFIDSSLTPKTVTAFGNATQSAAQSKWGGKSLALDGTGDYLSATGALSQFGTSDFAVEFWLYYVGTGVQYSIFDTRSSSSGFAIYKADDDTLNVFTSSDIISGGAISANTWHHIALARSGSNMKLFLNGTQTGSTFSTLQDYSDQLLTVGADFPRNGRFTQGYIDDLRITKGSARGYTANFTPPTAAFPTS